MTATLRAPFPWFGGKSRVADVVWRAFGNVPNYVEPFAGSLAVLLARPHEAKIETVNDKDAYLANFWRAVTHAPDEVARHCDWPVSEADLHARHRWLVKQKNFRERMLEDPDYYDAKIAGWWVWGLSQWIGGGWCHVSGSKIWSRQSGARPDLTCDGRAVHKKLPDLYARGEGKGVHQRLSTKTPNLSSHGGKGTGVTRSRGARPAQIPALNGGGKGITAPSRLPSLGNERGVHGAEKPPCTEWFDALCTRLRRVRVCCGDWKRVLGDSVLGTTKSRNSGMNPCGLFLDPPYSAGERDMDLYAVDDGNVAAAVREWAIAHGDDPDLRIALCGYEGEHEMPASWTVHAWKAHRGYANDANENKHRERIWFSPHCLPLEDRQIELFSSAGGMR